MKYLTLSSLLSFFILTACGIETDMKQQAAQHIARPAFMVERVIPAGAFGLNAWERMHQRGTSATIYIEGDSDIYEYVESFENNPRHRIAPKGFFGKDATHDNPIGLLLATRDQSENVAYLARPCQYVKFPEKKGCHPKYWGTDRFAPEVIESYHKALDEIMARWDITNFHIVGFGGGANIAAVLAAQRADILSLRTVAGDLNPRVMDQITTENPYNIHVSDDAVLAIDYAVTLSKMPQYHFLGAQDKIVTPEAYHSYRQAIGSSDCIHYSVIEDADHINGWVEKWPQLLAVKPQCAVVHNLNDELPPLLDFPGNYHKGKGSMRGNGFSK